MVWVFVMEAKKIIMEIMKEKYKHSSERMFVEMSKDVYDVLASKGFITYWEDIYAGAVLTNQTICGLPIKIRKEKGFSVTFN